MTFFLPKEPQPTGLPPAPDTRPPAFGERFAAGVEAERIEIDSYNRSARDERALIDQMLQATGTNLDDIPVRQRTLGSNKYLRAQAIAAASAAVGDSPGRHDAFGAGLPTTPEAFDEELTRRRKAAHDEAMALDPHWLGRLWAGVTDDVTIASLAVGAGPGSALRVIGTEAAAGAAGELATMPRQFEVAEDLDLPDPNVPLQVGIAAATGGVLAGGMVGAGRMLGYRRARDEAQAATRPEESSPGAHGEALDAARSELEDEQPRLPSEQARAARVDQMLDFIGDHEAPKGFDQVYSGTRLPPPRPITEMSVDEVLDWQDASANAGSASTAAGRFQIIRGTLRSLKDELGLSGDEPFDRDMQQRMAMTLMRRRGLDDWIAGRISDAEFGNRLAQEWAALPVLTGPGAGRSYYDGDGLNAAQASPDRFARVLGADGTYRSRLSGGTGDVPDAGGYTTSRGYTRTGQVTAGDDTRIDVEYEVVDAASLRFASGDLQPRDRSGVASDEQINEIAARLDPARLMPGPEADRGAPIVGPDGMIESGNGRVRAIQRAAAQAPDRMEAYRAQIEAAGFDIPEGVETPVLVARRTSDLSAEDRVRFVRDANTPSIARMTPAELAQMDRDAMTPRVVEAYQPDQGLSAPANGDFVRGFLSRLPQSERNALTARDGGLNKAGRDRLRAALFSRAYGDADLVARFVDEDAGELRSLMEALEAAAPAWAALRADVAAGTVRPEFDITPHVLAAMREIAAARALAKSQKRPVAAVIEDLLAEADLWEGALPPLTRTLMGKFAPGGRAAPAEKVGAFLRDYAAEARRVGGTDGQLFDAPGPLDVLQRMDADAFGELTELGGFRAEPEPAEPMAEGRYDEGADGPDAEEADLAAAEVVPAEGTDPDDAAAREALAEAGDLELQLDDGTTITAREVLEDLEADDTLQAVVDACPVGRAPAATGTGRTAGRAA